MIKIFLQTHRPGTKLSWTCIVYGGGNCKMKMRQRPDLRVGR